MPTSCLTAHGDSPESSDRRLVVVFEGGVATELAHLAQRAGWSVALHDPVSAPALDLDEGTDVVVCDHHRPELGTVLQQVLAQPVRWVGVMGTPRLVGPHVEALRGLGVSEDDIARVHRPIGLDIGSRTPVEIAVSAFAGLLADRNGRSGGAYC